VPFPHLARDLALPVNEVAGALGQAGRVQVLGPSGSGRTTLARLLVERLEAVPVTFPEFDEPDAAIHALLQMAAALDDEARSGVLDDAELPRERAARLAARLAQAGRIVVMRLPASSNARWEDADPGRQEHLLRARQVLVGLLGAPSLRIVLLTPSGFQWADLPGGEPKRFSLPNPFAQLCALEDAAAWGDCAVHAEHLAQLLRRASRTPSPLQVRLGVGLLAVGESEFQVERSFDGSLAAQAAQLLERAPPGLRDAVRRAAAIRGPIPRETLLAVAAAPAGPQTAVIAHCIAYGGGDLRVIDAVRQAARRRGSLRDPSPYQQLASHYRALDGASSPQALDPPRMVSWLEKVHHLGHSGPASGDEWSAQDLGCREFYWARARSLSRDYQLYEEAAALYRHCITRRPDDAYAWHYLGFNLDRAGRSAEDAGAAFARAVELDGDNPWWNSRQVSFLIGQARFAEGRDAWSAALRRIDPDGVQAAHDPWLANNLHAWVAHAWMEAGQPEDARDALAAVPRHILESDPRLAVLDERVCDALEAQQLGESVYPPGFPIGERWKQPRELAQQNHGSPLSSWYPGRVVEDTGDDEDVTLVFAVPSGDPAERRLLRNTMSRAEWSVAAGPAVAPRGFVAIGVYTDGSMLILPVRAPVRPGLAQKQPEDRLRYLRQSWQ
jgi:tetratricopeptide (TPR) repeat protein